MRVAKQIINLTRVNESHNPTPALAGLPPFDFFRQIAFQEDLS